MRVSFENGIGMEDLLDIALYSERCLDYSGRRLACSESKKARMGVELELQRRSVSRGQRGRHTSMACVEFWASHIHSYLYSYRERLWAL